MRSLVFAFASLAVVAAACSAGSHANDEVPVTADEPIITGVADPGHPAVVSLLMTETAADGTSTYAGCTGTMIGVNLATKVGYVLTAGHCVKNATTISVTQGSDKTNTTTNLGYAFIDYTAHPSYDGAVSSPYDIAMIRVLGVSATTPVLPVLTTANDHMAQGQTRVTSVGFGQTIRPNVTTDAGSNTAKNRIDGTVASLSSSALGVRYDNTGDICHGDSGGPVLTTVGGQEFVAGVHSYVTGPCVGVGYSVRASAYASFIAGIVAQPAPAATCETCRKTASSGTEICAEARRACYGDAECNGLRQCIAKCSAAATDAGLDAGTDDCKKDCAVQFPFGAAAYNHEMVFCSCNACESACAGDSACAAIPACGMKLEAAPAAPDSACNTCMDGACCAQEDACSKDGHCYRCARTPETPGCATDALYTQLQACKATSCSGTCP